MTRMKRVLVVDDRPDILGFILVQLEDAGYEVEVASNGKEALELQRRRAADVVVTDIFMPEMEGIETIHGLRRQFPDLKIIAMSGRDPRMKFDVFQVARELGAARTFKKPFRFEELVAAVRELQTKVAALGPKA